MAAIFDSRWLPFVRSNMADNAPCHLNVNFKFSELFGFPMFGSPKPPLLPYRLAVRRLTCVYVTHVYGIAQLVTVRLT